MKNLEELQKLVTRIRDERNWQQFHNPKDLAISLSLEAAELLEHFQWKNIEEINAHLKNQKRAVSHELADCFYWILLMANDFEIDLPAALQEKLEEINKKYPVEKSFGNHKKYTELEE